MDDQSRTKRPPGEFRLRRESTDHRRCQLVGERQILVLISIGAPLPGILNKLCMILDIRIGNVVSIVSLPDADENHFCAMTRSASQVGLEVFVIQRDFLRRQEFSQVHPGNCRCYSRWPTPLERHLIERVTRLAARALERHEGPADRSQPVTPPDVPLEKPPFIRKFIPTARSFLKSRHKNEAPSRRKCTTNSLRCAKILLT